jgi:regulator of protease activity HflC (stomatin/prohibitin superfamily)
MGMPNNRHMINDFDIVRPAQLLEKGLPIPGLSGRYVVDEGWCAVITEGGMFREVLTPGHHLLSKYSFWRDVKAIAIDVRLQPLKITTKGEMSIQRPYPVKIDLDLAVEYRVSDPRRVALEVKTPLTSLYDRVIQAVRSVLAYASHEDIRNQGETIASSTLQRLQAMQLPSVLGIEVFNVLIPMIVSTDVGNDAIAASYQHEYDAVKQQQIKEYQRLRDWQLESKITQESQVTWEWLLMHRPEVAQQLISTHGMLAKEMIDKGLLDPAGFLNQPAATSSQINPTNLLGGLGAFGGALPGGTGFGQPQLPSQPQIAGHLPGGGDIHARIREEVGYLEKLPGAKIDTKAGTDSRSIPDGSYDLRIMLPRSSGGNIALYVTCMAGYPQTPPVVEIEIDDQPTAFQSAILRRWTGQYIVEIAREVKQYFG